MVRAFAAADPTNTQYQLSLIEAQGWLADALLANGDLGAATRMREELVALLSRLASPAAANVEYQQRLVYAQAMLGALYFMGDQPGRAYPLFDSSLVTAERLIATEPENVRWKGLAMNSRFQYARALLRARRAGEAAPQVDEGCAIASALLSRNDEYTSSLTGARTCWTYRARLAILKNEGAQAEEYAGKAVAAAKRVKSVDPVSDRHELSEAFLALGDAHRTSGNLAAAGTAWRTAYNTLPRNARETPVEMEHRADVLQRVGRSTEARDIVRKLKGMGLRQVS
jgi:tetratricopeptide (TPR) repeat protein